MSGKLHCRGAITNGVSKEEIRAIIHIIGIYCGVPQALECFRVAKKVLEEQRDAVKALVYTDKETLVYREEANAITKEGEILIKVSAAGICGSDMHAYHGS